MQSNFVYGNSRVHNLLCQFFQATRFFFIVFIVSATVSEPLVLQSTFCIQICSASLLQKAFHTSVVLFELIPRDSGLHLRVVEVDFDLF